MTRVPPSPRRTVGARLSPVLLGCLCALLLPSAASATSADRSATHTFLQASYELDLALHRDAPETSAAISREGAAIAAECPKVLAGAPGAPGFFVPAGKVPSPRARGEADRHEHQFTELSSELEIALHATAYRNYASALGRFAAAVAPLHWSNPAIAEKVKFELGVLEAVFDTGPAPDVCADMRAWVASGYQTLAAGTKAALSRQEGAIATAPLQGGSSAEALVRPFEGPAERAIVRRTEALRPINLFEEESPVTSRLHIALGIEEAGNSGGFSKSVSFAQGHTHTGARFEVEAGNGPGSNCRHVISISLTTASELGSETSSTSSGLRCFSGGKPPARPRVSCDDGVIQIESSTLAQTRRVRLTLSDGRTIASSVTPVPPRFGGPAGIYFQTVRGPAPYPVSLTELDRTGRAVRTVGLRAVRRCVRHKASPSASPHQIVKGRAPNGQTFFILGTSSAMGARRTLSLEAEGSAFPSGGGEAAEVSTVSPKAPTGTSPKPYSWHLAVGCEPHPFALVYGQLEAPATTVLVAVGTGPLTPLTQVAIPKALDAQGTLAYALLEGLPSELVVQGVGGATLLREDLTARAKSDGEYCEGYAEPEA